MKVGEDGSVRVIEDDDGLGEWDFLFLKVPKGQASADFFSGSRPRQEKKFSDRPRACKKKKVG